MLMDSSHGGGGGECKFFAAHMNLLLITSLIGKIDPHELVEK
jgi:hypothetical protein